MKKFLPLLPLLFACLAVRAQVSNPSIIPVAVAPSGACSVTLPIQLVTPAGTLYSCQNGTWGVASGGGIAGWFNVKTYGAVGDGSTNDCAAIASANSALTTAGSGQLIFPTGNYFVGSACHLTISVPTVVVGMGKCGLLSSTGTGTASVCPTVITSTDTTGVLFTATANMVQFNQIGLINTASTPTAGSAILTNSLLATQEVDYDNIQVNGFYDDIDVNTGRSWHLSNSYISNPVRFGIRLQNIVNADFGDFTIYANQFSGSVKTTAARTAAIEYESGGGGKILSNKVVNDYTGNFQDGVYMNVGGAGSLETHIIANNIENVTNIPVNIVTGWDRIIITDNYLLAAGTLPAISITSATNFVIASNVLASTNGSAANAISVTSSTGTIAPETLEGFNSVSNATAYQSMGVKVVNTVLGAISKFGSTQSDSSIYIFNASNTRFANLIWAVGDPDNGGTPEWALGLFGGTAWNLLDNVASKSIITLPVNTMPAGSLTGNADGLIFGGLTGRSTLYSAAGTALPTCNAGRKGAEAVVSDASAPAYNATYTSGGAITSPVVCDGTNWKTY